MRKVNKSGFLLVFGLTSLLVGCFETQLIDNKANQTPPAESNTRDDQRLDHKIGRAVAEAAIEQRSRVAKQRVGMPLLAGVVAASYQLNTPLADRENYQQFDENAVKRVAEAPVSTFSVDVDTAAYSNIRRMIMQEGRLPPRDAVKVEEMINYFSYNYDLPPSLQQPFSVSVEMAAAPWAPQHQLLQIGLKGFEPAREQRPAANLVFLVDVSGSMRAADKLGLVKKSLRLLVNQMGAEDQIALVVYAGAAGLVLDSTSADQKARIMRAIDGLEAGGSTNGGAGIELAYRLAEEHFIAGGINRVLIASDGDMNVGVVSQDKLKALIEQKRKKGVALTTLGYGKGNYNYALMEQLAAVGNGNAAYIDSLKEAQKVLVEQLQSTLLTIAKDVKIQIEFNPQLVAEYRLLGYENRLLKREDFRNDKVDAGDMGAGHTVTALYELVMVADADTGLIAAKRYAGVQSGQSSAVATEYGDEIAFVKLRYKQPDADTSTEISQPILRPQQLTPIEDASANLRFASAVAGFGQLLRGGQYTGGWDYADALTLARNARGEDLHGYRAELTSLVELAQSLSPSGD
ncbi:MAG: VWA domain-containing protein [Pseudomonadales bacterium]|nr:VWA domain-containing protein [Pseudomonadales bacterium]